MKEKKREMYAYGNRKPMKGGRMIYKHGGGVHYYNSIEEKEKKCSEMVGYNESLKEKGK
jgi:hypothetical protein